MTIAPRLSPMGPCKEEPGEYVRAFPIGGNPAVRTAAPDASNRPSLSAAAIEWIRKTEELCLALSCAKLRNESTWLDLFAQAKSAKAQDGSYTLEVLPPSKYGVRMRARRAERYTARERSRMQRYERASFQRAACVKGKG